MDFAAGDLRERVTLQRGTATTDSLGAEVLTWADLDTVFASWRRATARETLAAAELSASVQDVFEIRKSSTVDDLTPKDRLIWKGKTYDIADVQPIGWHGLRIAAVARGE